MSALAWMGVAVLGGLGALARFAIDGFVASLSAARFPLGTLAVNLSGAFILGLVSGLAFSGDASTLVGTATVGSYTTFSTWMLETQRLREEGEFGPAAANVVVSLTAGLLAVALGRWLGGLG
jgi:CrcB protein